MKTHRLPILFVGHGSPMNALADNDFTRGLRAWGRRLPRPEAILCVSAHWYGDGVRVLGSAHPRTLHDFGGFPQELFDVQYPAPGHPALAAATRELLDGAVLTEEWGLDHGAWSVLLHLFPKADVPVFQVSLDRRRALQDHFDLAARLKPLREKGVLIVASGNIVHNLGELEGNPGAPPHPWAVSFDQSVAGALRGNRRDALTRPYESFPGAHLSAPTPDHYIPLLYGPAAAGEVEPVQFPIEGYEHAAISLRSVQWG